MLGKHVKEPFIAVLHTSLLIITGFGKLPRSLTTLAITVESTGTLVPVGLGLLDISEAALVSLQEMSWHLSGACNPLTATYVQPTCSATQLNPCNAVSQGTLLRTTRGKRNKGAGAQFWLRFRRALSRNS